MLLATKWPSTDFTKPGERARVSALLGVTEDVLQEAADICANERRKKGLRTTTGVKRREASHPQLELDFPEVVYDDWLTWVELQASNSNALIRGVLHEYLLNDWEPEWLGSAWQYKGKNYVLGKSAWEAKHHRAWPYRERTFVTAGAKEALTYRANLQNVSATAIVRGLVLEALAGRIAYVRPMDARALYDDPMRYRRRTE